ncbi:class I SAM-dependent methyltransferase [Candidatus Daviesbacteria bacterium]|nr:class I SAM-dependent methyltransferase [Candidatus Daviesbacteria bacterium]
MKFVLIYLTSLWHKSAWSNNQTLSFLIKSEKKAKILDLGTYRPELIIERVKQIKNPEIYVVDIDKETIKLCKKAGLHSLQRNLEKPLPFKDNFFDLITANQIIEHLVNVDLFIEEIYRVLKPNGYLLISTENLSSWHNIFALLMGWQAFSQHISKKQGIGNPIRLQKDSHTENSIHIHIFTLKGLLELLELNNFKIINTFGSGYYPLPTFFAKFFTKLDICHSAFIGVKAQKIKQ